MSEESLTAQQDGLMLSSMSRANSDGKVSAAVNHTLCLKIQATFADILSSAVLKVKIY
jgi:hypothetical protein